MSNSERAIWQPVFAQKAIALVRAIRVHQWAKNLLIFVPLVTGQRLSDPVKALAAVQAFLAFCLCASAAYLINDFFDLEADRSHPTKCNRPIASGEVSIQQAATLLVLLLASAIAIASHVSRDFIAVLALYFTTSVFYSTVVKRIAILDVLFLASLYALRIFAGSKATAVPISSWLLAFSTFFFQGLALVKRFAEMKRASETALGANRRGYRKEDLPVILGLGSASSCTAICVFALYVYHQDIGRLYPHSEYLWLICPLLFFWSGRVWLLAGRGEMNDDPVVFALRDWPSVLLGATAAGLLILSYWG